MRFAPLLRKYSTQKSALALPVLDRFAGAVDARDLDLDAAKVWEQLLSLNRAESSRRIKIRAGLDVVPERVMSHLGEQDEDFRPLLTFLKATG